MKSKNNARYPRHTASPMPWKLKTRRMNRTNDDGKPMRACWILDANGHNVMDEYADYDGSIYADIKTIVESVNAAWMKRSVV